MGNELDTSKSDPKTSLINKGLSAIVQAQTKAGIDFKITDENKPALVKQLIQTIYKRKIEPDLVKSLVSALAKAKF